MNQTTAVTEHKPISLVGKIAAKFGVEPEKMLATLKATAFKVPADKPAVTNEQMMALLIVSDQYGLNPFTKEIFAFPDKGGIVPVVSVDGWIRIINEHHAFDGMEFVDSETVNANGVPDWTECIIYRKDRSHPIKIRERYSEVRRDTQPWKSHPARMLRHKTLIQCARVAFGFAGIYDEDEGVRILERAVDVTPTQPEPTEKKPESRTASVAERLKREKARPLDVEPETQAAPQQEEPAEMQQQSPRADGIVGETPVTTYKQSLYIIENTKDRDIALEALDVARSCLIPGEVDHLASVFKSRFEAAE